MSDESIKNEPIPRTPVLGAAGGGGDANKNRTVAVAGGGGGGSAPGIMVELPASHPFRQPPLGGRTGSTGKKRTLAKATTGFLEATHLLRCKIDRVDAAVRDLTALNNRLSSHSPDDLIPLGDDDMRVEAPVSMLLLFKAQELSRAMDELNSAIVQIQPSTAEMIEAVKRTA